MREDFERDVGMERGILDNLARHIQHGTFSTAMSFQADRALLQVSVPRQYDRVAIVRFARR